MNVALSNVFYRLMTEPSFKCIEDDLDERDLKALSVVSISTGLLFFETLLQNNAKNKWFFGYCTQSTASSLADGQFLGYCGALDCSSYMFLLFTAWAAFPRLLIEGRTRMRKRTAFLPPRSHVSCVPDLERIELAGVMFIQGSPVTFGAEFSLVCLRSTACKHGCSIQEVRGADSICPTGMTG